MRRIEGVHLVGGLLYFLLCAGSSELLIFCKTTFNFPIISRARDSFPSVMRTSRFFPSGSNSARRRAIACSAEMALSAETLSADSDMPTSTSDVLLRHNALQKGHILQIKEILEPAVDAQKSLGSSGDVNGTDASGMTVIAEEEYARYLGVIAVTAASCLSGLERTSTQISLQAVRRSAQVLTIEMAIASIPIVYFVHVSKLAFGDELFVQQAQPHLHEEQDEAAATPTPTGNLVSSAAIQRLLYAGSTKWSSMFDNFTFLTFIPIFTSAIGGICVGLVTKNLGSVAKGFAITLGLTLTGVIESVTRGEMLQTEQIVGLLLVGACTHAHTVYAVHEPLVTNSQIRIAQANAERRDRQKKRIRDQSAKKFAK